VRFDGPVDTLTSSEITGHVVATIRKALANVARHAHATCAGVTVTAGDEIVLTRTTGSVTRRSNGAVVTAWPTCRKGRASWVEALGSSGDHRVAAAWSGASLRRLTMKVVTII